METTNKSPYVIGQIEGYSKDFSALISMMNYTRETTEQAVKDLSIEALDYRINGIGNSIGMLLAHLAAVEKIYQYITFNDIDMDDPAIEEYADTLQPALDLGEKATVLTGKPVEYYLEELQQTRQETLEKFRALPESWLYETTPWWYGKEGNNYFKWFHVFEDELSHRGQIRIIKKQYELQQK